MSHTETIVGQNGSNWLVNLPDQIQFSQANHTANGPYYLDANASGHGPLTIDVHIDPASIFGEAHGLLTATINDLDGSGQGTAGVADATNGLRGSIVLTLHNELGVPIGGPLPEAFGVVFVGNNDLRSDTEANPSGHPLYAHFHGVPTTADGLTIDAAALFGDPGTPGAPDTLSFSGAIPAGGTASIPIATWHERDVAGQDDSFFLTWYPTENITSSSDFAALQAKWDAEHNPSTGGDQTGGDTTGGDTTGGDDDGSDQNGGDQGGADDGGVGQDTPDHGGHAHHGCGHDVWMG